MELQASVATLHDWDKLKAFYKKIYKPGHPLQHKDFWNWQYGDSAHGSALIVADGNAVYGHVGASFVDGYAWMINVYMDETLRGQGWVGTLYKMARRAGYPLAATSANMAGLGLYRKMNWIRYTNLERWVLIRPGLEGEPFTSVIRKITPVELPNASGHQYWKQPGINGVQLEDGSTANAQWQTGGLRFADLVDPARAVQQAWDAGFTWCDYISSWNDPLHDQLPKMGWSHQSDVKFPWYVLPVDELKPFAVSYLSEEPMDKKFIVKRYHSDHGRVGSL